MSQLASFTELPVRAVQLLIPAALPRRRLFRRPESKFNDYLQEHGKDLEGFGADGFYIVLVLMYLRKFERINLLDANRGLALMAQSLTKHQDTFFTFFTDEDRERHAAVRAVVFDELKLRQLCERDGIEYDLYSHLGTMKAAAERIADILSNIKDEYVVLVSVG